MKTEIVQIIFLVMVTLFATIAQDLCPSFAGTKPPFIALVALCHVLRPRPSSPLQRIHHAPAIFTDHTSPMAILLAGFVLDTWDNLPFGCATLFLGLTYLMAHILRPLIREHNFILVGFFTGVLVAPLFELWLHLWIPQAKNISLLIRTLAVLPTAALAGLVIFTCLPIIRRAIGLDLTIKDLLTRGQHS